MPGLEKERLSELLDAEIEAWSVKPYGALVEQLSDIVAYGRGEGPDFHQFEVQLLEHEPDYVHVTVLIDDGTLLKSFSPLNRSFIVYRDGRVDK